MPVPNSVVSRSKFSAASTLAIGSEREGERFGQKRGGAKPQSTIAQSPRLRG
jgi:hypothetical protein